jgi:hypothetical protein
LSDQTWRPDQTTGGDSVYAKPANIISAPGWDEGFPIVKTLDEAQSRELAKAIPNKVKTPFDKADAAIVLLPDAVYVQGFVVFPGAPFAPIEHAWLEVGETIVDPAFVTLRQKAENLHYFPAQTLSLRKLKQAIELAQEDYPEDDPLPIYGSEPYDYYGDVMLGGQEYTVAFEAAKTKCRELNAVKPKSKPMENA